MSTDASENAAASDPRDSSRESFLEDLRHVLSESLAVKSVTDANGHDIREDLLEATRSSMTEEFRRLGDDLKSALCAEVRKCMQNSSSTSSGHISVEASLPGEESAKDEAADTVPPMIITLTPPKVVPLQKKESDKQPFQRGDGPDAILPEVRPQGEVSDQADVLLISVPNYASHHSSERDDGLVAKRGNVRGSEATLEGLRWSSQRKSGASNEKMRPYAKISRSGTRDLQMPSLSRAGTRELETPSDVLFGAFPQDEEEPELEICTEEKKFGPRQFALSLVKHPYFDYFFGVAIIINALSIGIQTEYMARSFEESTPVGLQVFDVIFCLMFMSEIALRLLAFRCKFFYQIGWKWNWFDFILVAMQLMEESSAIVARITDPDAQSSSPGDASSKGTQSTGNLSFFRMLRVLRLVRVIRLARVLRLVRQLRTLVTSIGASLQSLAWTVLLIIFMIYAVGIYFTQLVTNHLVLMTEEALQQFNTQEMLRYFGTLDRSCLSLFQAISGGISWGELVRPLAEDISPLVTPLFTFYVAFSVLAMMNVVTGVFVESALQSSCEDKEEYNTNQLYELFNEYDDDNDGFICVEEMEGILADSTSALRLAALDIKPREARNLFALIDTECNGQISIAAFIMGCLRLRGSARSIDVTTMMFEQKRFLQKWDQFAEHVTEALAVSAESRELHQERNDDAQAEHVGKDEGEETTHQPSSNSPGNRASARASARASIQSMMSTRSTRSAHMQGEFNGRPIPACDRLLLT